jgi:putative copper resistance protein D
MTLHVAGAVLWTGGLFALLLGRRRPSAALAHSVRRFSALALCCVVAVLLTGLAGAALRMSGWNQFDSGYGRIVLLKLAALAALGAFGWWHRSMSIPRLAAGCRGMFTRIAVVEVLVMSAALGLAGGLSRTPPPDDAHSAAVIETPFRTVLNWLPDPLFLTLGGAAVAAYLVGVRRLRRGGETWPVSRTATWVAGWIVVGLSANLQLARAGEGTFLLLEKVQHVAIAVVAPMLLVGGGGIALARRTLVPASEPGMRGPGEWLTELLESRAVLVLTHPAAVVLLYGTVLYGVYASALYTLSLRSHAGHLILFAAALAAGGLYYWPLLGLLAPRRELPHATRLALLVSATLMQVVLGIALTRQIPLGTHAALWAGACALLAVGTWVVHRADREPIDVELPAPADCSRSPHRDRLTDSTDGVEDALAGVANSGADRA